MKYNIIKAQKGVILKPRSIPISKYETETKKSKIKKAFYEKRVKLDTPEDPYIDSANNLINARNIDFSVAVNEQLETPINPNNPVLLKEVIKTPSKEDLTIKRYLKELVPEKNQRDMIYKSASILNEYGNRTDNSYALRLARLHKLSGSPTIHRLYREGSDRAYYINNNLHVSTPRDLIEELAHAYAIKNNITPISKLVGTDIIYGSQDNVNKFGEDGYQQPRHYEYQTHKIVSPELRRFLGSKYATEKNYIKEMNENIKKDIQNDIKSSGVTVSDFITQSFINRFTNKLSL